MSETKSSSEGESLFARYDAVYEKIGLAATLVKFGDKKPLTTDWTKHQNLKPADRQEAFIYGSRSSG